MACRCLGLLIYWSLSLRRAETTELFGTVKVEGYAPKARQYPSTVLYKKCLWTYGGLFPDNPTEKIKHVIFDDLNCFDTDSQTWTHVKVAADGAPKPKIGHCAVLDFAGTMWLWGGTAFDSNSHSLSYDVAVHSLNLNEIDLDPKDNKSSGAWQKVEVKGNAPPGRWLHSAVMNGTGMVIFGGRGKDLFADVHYLDFKTQMWSEIQCQGDVPSARMSHRAAMTSLGEMWVYGGQDIHQTILEDLYYLKFDLDIWVKVATKGVSPGPLAQQVQVLDAAGRMWLAGGWSTEQRHNDKVFYIDTTKSSREWKEVEELHGAVQRSGAGAAIERNGRMWCYGGNSPKEDGTYPEILASIAWLDTNQPAPSTATTSAHPLDPAASGGIGTGTILVIVLVVAVVAAGTFFSLPWRRERRLLQEVQEPQQVELGPRA